MDAFEKIHWRLFFSELDSIRDGSYETPKAVYDTIETHLLKNRFITGRIIVPALEVEIELGDKFYLFQEVKDPERTAEFINAQINKEFGHAFCGKNRFYGYLDYDFQDARTELNFLLLRKGLDTITRKTEECLLSADLLYTIERTPDFYSKYGISQEEQDKILSITDFEKLAHKVICRI